MHKYTNTTPATCYTSAFYKAGFLVCLTVNWTFTSFISRHMFQTRFKIVNITNYEEQQQYYVSKLCEVATNWLNSSVDVCRERLTLCKVLPSIKPDSWTPSPRIIWHVCRNLHLRIVLSHLSVLGLRAYASTT